jgi:quercetin dioxygenase-like cupin family protein
MTEAFETGVDFHPISEAESFWVLGDQVSLRGSLPSLGLHVIDVTVPPGSGVPPPSHAPPEIFRVVEGRMIFAAVEDGATRETEAGAGDVVTVAPHAPHGYRNASDQPARMTVLLHEQMVGFFKAAASEKAPPPGPPPAEGIARIMKLAAEHGIVMLAP